MACHDGTVTTTYDVQSGKIGTGKGAMGGAFGTNADTFSSNHNVTGALQISAAPGGSTVAETFTIGTKAGNSMWTPTFGCESCHTPHGNGGNARILNPDTNFTATKAAAAVTTGYNVVGGVVYNNGVEAYILKGYPYTISITDAAGVVAGATLDNTAGYSVVVGGVATKVYGTPAIQVKMNITNYLAQTETVTHVYGMNAFCGACHADYNTQNITHSSDTESGTYTQAHRHQVGVPPLYNGQKDNLPAAGMALEGGNLECLTCHVAHGVNADYWARTVGTTGGSGYLQNTDLAELAGSSALKRLPNMGTCEACHQKGVSAEGYAANSGSVAAGTSAIVDGLMPTLITTTNYSPVVTATKGWVGSAACNPCHADYVTGWAKTKHATQVTTGHCGPCHATGKVVMNTGTFVPGQVDTDITCEACHGSAAKHVAAPSTKNIYAPRGFTQEVAFCARCHDTYGNYNRTVNLTVASFTYFANANHGGTYMYNTSKHYTQGIASCTTCHDSHGMDANAKSTVKLNYQQLCSSCHDSVGPLSVTMGTNLKTSTFPLPVGNFNHSFKFGGAGSVISNTYYGAYTNKQLLANNNAILNPSGSVLAVDLSGTISLYDNVYQTATGGSGVFASTKLDGAYSVSRLDGTISAKVYLNGTTGTTIPSAVYINNDATSGQYVINFTPTGNVTPLTIGSFNVQ